MSSLPTIFICDIASNMICWDMRIVMDTDVLVAAFRSPRGASREIMRLLYEGIIEGAASVPLMLEYEEVMLRPEQREATGLTVSEVHSILDQLAVILHSVMTHFLWRSCLRDPDDELVLEAAVNGRADVLVTFNVRDYFPAVQFFRLEILRPAELLRRL
jgi:putative PIN family toxin of toxin-antitoxin system